jgi:nicotinamide-nucleotide amidase
MRAEILTIGDELCRGEIVDTNSSYLAARLWDLDITTRWMTSCTDDVDDIATAVAQAVARADLVVCSGGLGPTEDDLTVDVLARLVGAEVVIDEPARARMMEKFGRLLSSQAPLGNVEELTRIQLRQVRVPAGARVHGNPVGLAPCFEVAVGGVPVVALPGVPRELHGIYDGALAARFAELREAGGAVERIARRIYRAFGRGESQVSQACRGLVDGVAGASIHYQVKFPETLVKLVVRDRDQAAADARLDALDAGVRERLAGVVYGTGEAETLVERVTRRLIESGSTIATAESCTGGMLGELLTRMPGSSKAYRGGAITYADAEKVRQLGVPQGVLDEQGAVSEATVRLMALGARERFGVDVAVAISGIAGPDGGTPDKPVGTVWIAAISSPSASAVAGDAGSAVLDQVITKRLSWPGARDQIRLLSAWWALKLVDELLDQKERG